ncbi:hypothetical protein K7B10_04625 [Streptomyces flavotricini]|uniref:Uncharacterized protein n=1 Tax=Streptomyces flavotricini TaxID=66888 RepID=A0ABS8DYX4_9ACTN|nr:hypothetical protein [Streptomyces flavotricini]MCC0094085.1 hypothetical protein [Streptomyces flavotricini]
MATLKSEAKAFLTLRVRLHFAGSSVRLVNAPGHRAVPLTDGMLEGRPSDLPADAEAAA